MTILETYAEFVQLPTERQLDFLLRLALGLTVRARGAYSPGPPDGERLRAFNEIQHRLAAHALHLSAGNAARYPDDVFVALLTEIADAGGVGEDLRVAAAAARRQDD